MISYGVDYSVFNSAGRLDVDLTFTQIADPYTVIEQDIYKKIFTPSGVIDPPTGVFWDENTMSIRDSLLQAFTPEGAHLLERRLDSIFFNELRFSLEAAVEFVNRSDLNIMLYVTPSGDLRPMVLQITAGSNQVTFERVS